MKLVYILATLAGPIWIALLMINKGLPSAHELFPIIIVMILLSGFCLLSARLYHRYILPMLK